MAWRLEDRIDSFINGLRNPTIKRMISLENYSGSSRSIENVRDHAIYLRGRMSLTEAQEGTRRRNVAAASVASASRSAQRKKAKKIKPEVGAEASTSAAAVSADDKLQQSKRWMRKLGLVGACWSCMRYHQAAADFSTCDRKCVFCEKTFSRGDRHFPFECRSKPVKEAAIVAMWKKMKAQAKSR